jgi:hypothetical protein
MKTLNKTILFTLISIFLIFKFQVVFSQPLTVPQMVPVIDTNAIKTLIQINDSLNSLLSITTEQFNKANKTLLGILETKYEEAINKIFTDSLKEEEYQEYSTNLIKFVQSRQDMAANKMEIEPVITEAKNACAYKTLKQLPNNIPCINPNTREKFTNYLISFMAPFGLSEKAQEIADQIPDCYIQGNTTPAFKKINFFAWLTKPFQLNLAQVGNNINSSEASPISISPAFQDTEDSAQLANTKSLVEKLIITATEECAQKMEKTIGDTFPVMQCIEETTEFDGGQYVCLEQQILLSSKELQDIKNNINLTNPLDRNIQDINIHKKFTQTQDLFKKIGLMTTTTISSSSDLTGNFSDEKEVQNLIKQTCEENFVSEDNDTDDNDNVTKTTKSIAYAICIKQFNKKLKVHLDIKKKQLTEIEQFANNTNSTTENLLAKANSLLLSLASCKNAQNDVMEIIEKLNGKRNNYLDNFLGPNSTLKKFQQEFNIINNQASSSITEINKNMQKINATLKKVSEKIGPITKNVSKALENISSFLGFDVGLDINRAISTETIKQIENTLKNVTQFSGNINNLVQQSFAILAGALTKFTNFNFDLAQSNVLRTDLLNDNYSLKNASQKLDAYERLAQKGGCSQSSTAGTSISLLNKNPVIVIESKKSEPKSINFLALIKNFWQPKLVEFKNEQ